MSTAEQPVPVVCNLCNASENLMRCGKCKLALYCSKEHQKTDWKNHKKTCKKLSEVQLTNSPENRYNYTHSASESTMPYEGSSESEILSTPSEFLNNNFEEKSTLYQNHTSATTRSSEPVSHSAKKTMKLFSEVSIQDGSNFRHNLDDEDIERIKRLAPDVIRDMNEFGVCLLDNFLGEEEGLKVLEEVKRIKEQGILQDGQLVSKKGVKTHEDTKTIRSDKITWLHGREKGCEHIGRYISKVDALITRANKLPNNGKLGQYTINGRTKAMVACYPGSGAHYVKHVDNPNKDGRCITSIYYLNVDWDAEKCGGVLRIFPEGYREDKVADIAPIFDRLLLFWSDRRNPHEVRPALCDRFAITLWYFDAKERAEASQKYERENATNYTNPVST